MLGELPGSWPSWYVFTTYLQAPKQARRVEACKVHECTYWVHHMSFPHAILQDNLLRRQKDREE